MCTFSWWFFCRLHIWWMWRQSGSSPSRCPHLQTSWRRRMWIHLRPSAPCDRKSWNLKHTHLVTECIKSIQSEGQKHQQHLTCVKWRERWSERRKAAKTPKSSKPAREKRASCAAPAHPALLLPSTTTKEVISKWNITYNSTTEEPQLRISRHYWFIWVLKFGVRFETLVTLKTMVTTMETMMC